MVVGGDDRQTSAYRCHPSSGAAENARVPVRLLNLRAEPLMVYAGMELATLEKDQQYPLPRSVGGNRS